MCSGSTPTGIPIPSAKIATRVSPGCLTSIRRASPRSSARPVSHAQPRPSRSASLWASTPPKAARAAARLLGLESGFANAALGLHLDVEAELVVHSTFGVVLASEQEAHCLRRSPRVACRSRTPTHRPLRVPAFVVGSSVRLYCRAPLTMSPLADQPGRPPHPKARPRRGRRAVRPPRRVRGRTSLFYRSMFSFGRCAATSSFSRATRVSLTRSTRAWM